MSGLDPSRWGDASEIRALRRAPLYLAPPPPSSEVIPPSVAKAKSKKNKKKNERRKAKKGLNGQSLIDSNTLQRKLVKLLFDLKKSKVPSDKLSTLLMIDPALKTVPISSKDIPFDLANFFKGTQNPTFRLYIVYTELTFPAASGGSPYTSVFPIEGAALGNFSDFAAVFDEYRVISGMVEYRRKNVMNIRNSSATTDILCPGVNGLAVIDYDDNTAIASMAAGTLYDTKKRVNFAYVQSGPMSCEEDDSRDVARWPLKFEKLPDQDWIDSGTGSTDFAYWKPFVQTGDLPPSAWILGYLSGWVDVQYRGQH